MKFGFSLRRQRAATPGQPVTLAIDDGPSDVTRRMLAQLERGGHRAVLFIMGANVAGREALIVDAVRRGFALGNHSFNHPHFSTIDMEEARAEIERTEAIIEAAYARARVKRPGKWFRFPYLDTGDQNFAPLQALLGEMGFERPHQVGSRLDEDDLERIDWPTTVSTRDWALPEEAELRAALRETRTGDVIEFHDKPETVHRYCAALVDELSALSLHAAVPVGGHGATA